MIKFFEELEPPEGIRAELLRRTIVMTPSPDPVHALCHDGADEPMPLEPLGIELDTSEFATYEKVRPHRYP